MIRYKQCTVLERLNKLYSPQEAKEAFSLIQDLVNNYKAKIKSKPWKISEQDCILITYGDSLKKDDSSPLQTLIDFNKNYIKDTINTIHILPFYPYSSDDGFSVIDYKAVNPQLGNWNDVSTLAQESRLMFDCVINHISQYSAWFQAYLKQDPKYKNYFLDVPADTDTSMVVRPRALPLLSPFEDAQGNIKLVWTTFSRDQVDLNYSNYKVLIDVIDVLFFYAEKGAKHIRLDAIAFVWKKLGTSCIHLQETHEIIQLMREVLHKVAPEVVIITETNVPHKENISYFGSGDDEAQMVYNFALPPLLAHSIITANCTHLNQWASELTLPSDKVCFFNFTASHDGIGLRPISEILNEDEVQELVKAAEFSGGRVSMRSNGDGTESPYELNCNYMDLLSPLISDQEEKVKRMLLSQSITLAMPGVPGIYIHSLLGSKNDIDGMLLTGVNRSINREKLSWEELEVELSDESTQRHQIFEPYQKMLRIRKEEPAFNPYASFEVHNFDSKVFAMTRTSIDGKSKLLILANFAGHRHSVNQSPYEGSYQDLLSGNTFRTAMLFLEPHQVLWLKIND